MENNVKMANLIRKIASVIVLTCGLEIFVVCSNLYSGILQLLNSYITFISSLFCPII